MMLKVSSVIQLRCSRLLFACFQVINAELLTMHQFVTNHVSDHSGFHYRQFLLDCLALCPSTHADDVNGYVSTLNGELKLTEDLSSSYPGHEAIWYHRLVRFLCDWFSVGCPGFDVVLSYC